MKEKENNGGWLCKIGLSALIFACGYAGKYGYSKWFGETEKKIRKQTGECRDAVKRQPDEAVLANYQFEKVSSEQLDLRQYTEDPLDAEEQTYWKGELSRFFGNDLNTAMAISSFDGLLRCDIPISELSTVKGNEKLLRGYSKKGQKFARQAKFSRVGLQRAAPMLVFQYLSAVTGQYYMHQVVMRLDQIRQGLDQIAKDILAAKKGELQGIYSGLELLSQKTQYGQSDVISADTLLRQAEMLSYEFLNKVIDYDPLSVEFKCNTDLGCVEKMVNIFDQNRFSVNLQLAAMAEVVVYLAILVRARIAYYNFDESGYGLYMDKLSMENWSLISFKLEQTKACMLKYINLHHQRANIYDGKIKEYLTKMKKVFDECNQQIADYRKVLESAVPIYFRLDEEGNLKMLCQSV